MAELRTDLQRRLMACIVVKTRERSRERVRAGEVGVTTAELSEMTGRFGQVIGHSCGAMADRGLLWRAGPARYALTRAGLEAATEELRGYVLERDDGL